MATLPSTPPHSPSLRQKIEHSHHNPLKHSLSPQSPPQRKNIDLIQKAFVQTNHAFNSISYTLEENRPTKNDTTALLTFNEPQVDENYEIISELGKGTFGKFAIKRIDMTALKSSREKKNISRELRLLKILHHPNIIQVIDIIETKTTTYIIMEYCPKGELHDYITSKGRLAENEARQIFRQVVSAIDYCHEDGTGNIIKLIDFGFGNTWNEHGYLNTFCGSPFYAAPEMTQGIEYVGPEVDIWSLGVILYMMLTGELPFQGANIPDLYASIAKGTYVVPGYISEEAKSLLARMLDVQPRRRATLEEIKNHTWTIFGYKYAPISGVPHRENQMFVLDEETLQELVSLGYSRQEYYQEFKNTQKSPIKNLYHLHYEWLQRKKLEHSKKQTEHQQDIVINIIKEVEPLPHTMSKPKHTSFWARILGKNKYLGKKCLTCIRTSCVCNAAKGSKFNNAKVHPL